MIQWGCGHMFHRKDDDDDDDKDNYDHDEIFITYNIVIVFWPT